MNALPSIQLRIEEITFEGGSDHPASIVIIVYEGKTPKNTTPIEKKGKVIVEVTKELSVKVECFHPKDLSLGMLDISIPPSGSELKEYEWTCARSPRGSGNRKIKVSIQCKWVKPTKWKRPGWIRGSKPRPAHKNSLKSIDPRDTLRVYVQKKNVEGIREIMNNPQFSLNEPLDAQGNTLLHLICDEGFPSSLLEELLKITGVNVKIFNKAENTPLHYLCSKWPYPEVEIFEHFVTLGADVNARNKSLETPLFKAMFNRNVRKPIVKKLLLSGADPNLLNSYNEGILHYIVRKSNEDILKLILTRCEPQSLKQKGKEGLTPKEIALAEGNKHKERAKEYNRIYQTLNKVEELDEFLSQHNLLDQREYFIEEGLDLDELSCWNEEQIERLQIKLGPKQKLIRALAERKQRHQKKKTTAEMEMQLDRLDSSATSDIETLKGAFTIKQVPFIEYDRLEFLDRIGNGAFGVVWRGQLRESSSEWGVEVAIKKLTSDTPKESLEDFKKEVTMLQSISHPNIVKLFGVCLEPSMMLVMEYCSRGTLYHVMSSNDSQIVFKWERFFSIVFQTAEGLNALHNHTPKILHRDIKPHNLLITQNWEVKVADFGLSLENSAQTDVLTQPSGTSAYMAPELCKGIKYSTKSDVCKYSYRY
eukprot:TRINITY_DN7339_c0_g1_i2.p1 TRINITY_DN7339_c0_g1~~TRINITY_DN7339_c0_g1_i2.p1  ORF type:complete len:648 (+),score=125.67 TRINITY_DN7339_c0_g1_i2:29-1972(+)